MSNGSVKRTADSRHGTSKRRAEAAQIPYKDDETVKEILDDTLHAGVLDAITVTDAGGLNITWTAGEIYTPAGDIVVTVAGSGACTDDALCYLIWVSGTTLTLGVAMADPETEVAVAHVSTGDGDIYDTHEEDLITTSLPLVEDSLAQLLPIVVTAGCLVSATNPGVDLEVSVSTGVFIQDGHNVHNLTGFDTSTASTLIRCNINAGGPLWLFVTGQDFPDFTQWNNGNVLQGTAAAKYYRSLFIVSEANVFWVYPQAEYATLNAALDASDPTVPAGIANFPKSIAYVFQHGDTQYQAAGSEQWVDVRPLLASSTAATAGGIQNVVEDSTPQLGGSLDSNGNPIAMKTTDKITFHDSDIYIHATADGNLLVRADTLLTLGILGTTEFGDGTLRVVRPNTDLKIDLGDVTHYFNAAYIKAVQSLAGSGTATYLHGGVIDVDTTTVGHDGVGLDPLITYAMPANTLATNGDSLEIVCAGVFADTANNKTLNFKVGATAVYSQGAGAARDSSWEMRCTVIRDASDTQRISLQFQTDDAVFTDDAVYVVGGEADDQVITIFCSATCSAANDIEQHFMKTIYHPAP